MNQKLRESRSVSPVRKIKGINTNKQSSSNIRLNEFKRKSLFEDYGTQTKQIPAKVQIKDNKKDKYHYNSTTCGESDYENDKLYEKITHNKSKLRKQQQNSQKIDQSPISINTLSSISSQQIKGPKSQKILIFQQINNKLSMKQISTKTSIKLIEQINPSYQRQRLKSPYLRKRQIKQKTQQITIKGLIKQLKQVKKQNKQIKEELIRVKSDQYYVFSRQKVKQMVENLQSQIQNRQNVQNINIKLRQENQRLLRVNKRYRIQNILLKNTNFDIKKENIRLKRCTVRLQEQILNIQSNGKPLRERIKRQERIKR